MGYPGALVVQAMAFGLVHYVHGVPNGAWGARCPELYGLALGVIHWRAGGILAPWIAHVIADAALFALLVVSAF